MPGSPNDPGRRVAALGGGVLMLVAACTAGSPPQTSLRVLGGGGDVWAWEATVQATASGCDDLSFEVNGSPTAATRGDDDRFQATIPIAEGRNEVVAMCGTARSDPVVYVGMLVHRPTARIALSLRGSDVVLDARRSERDGADPSPIETYRWLQGPDNPEDLTFDPPSERDRVVRLKAPSTDGEYYVWLEVTDADGRTDRAGTYFVVERGRPRIPDFDRENPAWVERAVVYGVIPPLFGNPALQGVERRLPKLKELGVDAIWLSPINGTVPGDFGYAVTNYFGVRPDYGTEEDLRSLVRTAHRLGIRVLMDFVPNHTSIQHPYYRHAERYGEASRHWDYYDRGPKGNHTFYFDWDYLPNLNYENPEVRRFMMAAFSYWVREFDIDGFRVDVSWGVKMRRPGFWPEWRDELKRVKPDLLLLAEASARDGYYFENGFDVAYDWTEELGHWAWGGAFDAPEIIAEWLDRALTAEGRGYHEDALVFRFMNNNDTDVRFVDRFGIGVARVAAAMLLTLPGVPLVYTGDEIGASYLPYSNLTPLTWGKDRHGLREYYTRLIALRHDVSALRSRAWERVETDAGAHIYSYVRWAEDHPMVRFDDDGGGPPVLVVLNYGAKTDVTFTANDRVAGMAAAGRLVDLLSGESFPVERAGPLRIPVPRHTALLLTVPGGGS